MRFTFWKSTSPSIVWTSTSLSYKSRKMSPNVSKMSQKVAKYQENDRKTAGNSLQLGQIPGKRLEIPWKWLKMHPQGWYSAKIHLEPPKKWFESVLEKRKNRFSTFLVGIRLLLLKLEQNSRETAGISLQIGPNTRKSTGNTLKWLDIHQQRWECTKNVAK